MNRHMVTKTRELIACGFYDDPEILEVLWERCLEAILGDVNRGAGQGTRSCPSPGLRERAGPGPGGRAAPGARPRRARDRRADRAQAAR
jgi:hypothetical protein